MGEKGNISSEELLAAGGGAPAAGAGAHVTAVLEEASDTVRDKVIDKGADAAIEAASDKFRKPGDPDAPGAGPRA
jgi:hypothetical protein